MGTDYLGLGEGIGLLKKTVSGILLILLFTVMFLSAINVKPAKSTWTGTIYIKADGSIDPSDAPISTIDNITYTLTGNITSVADGIVVERDNIIIDGVGYTIAGSMSYTGIDLTGRNNVTIKNIEISAFYEGIWLSHSSNNIISGNKITNNRNGICLRVSSNNAINGNNLEANSLYGIWMQYSSNNNTISGNTFVNDGLSVWYSYGNIVMDNTVNGKPLVYLENVSDYAIEDAGQVILINCENILVENLNLSNADIGIRLWGTNNTKIIRNNITANSYDGIILDSSMNNMISGNNISVNAWHGICLCYSSNNTINGNSLIGNTWAGIQLDHSSNNTIYHNNFINNTQQAYSLNSVNVWDDGYPSGGNYWSDYNGTDLFSGPYQNETGSDGMGDTPYVIDENNQDNYPLMSPWSPVTLTVIGPWSGPEMDKFLPVLARFEALTGINVRYKVYRAEELATLLPAQFAAGTTPGDVIFMWGWFIAESAQEGHILEVTDLVNESDFLLGALDPVKVGDKLYGGAYTCKVKPGFWYRKSFFEAYGLTSPTTWDEFVALLNDIAAIPGIVNPIATGDGIGWPLSDIVEHFLITFGGPQLHKDLMAGTVSWNSSQVKSIFDDRIVPLLEGEYFSEPIEWTAALNLWWNGDYGLYFMGSWITEMVDDPDDLGVFSLPGAEGVVFSADYFFIPTYTEHTDEAKQLFQFLASTEAQSIQVAQGGRIATNIHVPLDAYPPADRTVAEAIEGMEVLPDLDDSIGGDFQTTFWDQLKLLWVNPAKLDQVLAAIEAVAPKPPTPPFATATIDIAPDTLNLKSKGKWITAYIELPEGYNISDINVSTILLNDTVSAELSPSAIGDYDNDSVPDLMVCFNRTEVIEYILAEAITFGNVTLTISGSLYDGIPFKGSFIIAVSDLAGDVNCDGKVDIYDIIQAASSYSSGEEEPNWNPNANFAPPWNEIDIIDLVTIAANYGKTHL